MSEIKVLIVEDEPLIAEDIGEYLSNSDYSVLAIVHNMKDALKVLQNHTPDIALLDINLNGELDGFKIAEEINLKYKFPFLYLTSYADKATIDKAKYTRPMGYIVKPFVEVDLYSSIEIALYNFSQLNKPKALSKDLVNQKIVGQITDKEFKVLMDMYEGLTNKQMSAKHFVSINTIKTHIQKLYDKLDVHSRTEVLAKMRALLA